MKKILGILLLVILAGGSYYAFMEYNKPVVEEAE